MKLKKEHKIGIVTIISLALFIWVANFLKGNNIFNTEDRYYAVYQQSGGIAVSTGVFINGMKVGRVGRVGFMGPEDTRIRVQIKIYQKIKIPINSIASLESNSLLGGKVIVIYLGDSEEYMEEDAMFITREVPDLLAQIDPIKIAVGDLFSSVDTLIRSLNAALNPKALQEIGVVVESLSKTALNLEKMSADAQGLLAHEKENLSKIIRNVEEISESLHHGKEDISNMLSNFSNLSDTLAQANIKKVFADLGTSVSSLNNILLKMDSGEGSLGQLISNDSLYKGLENSSYQLSLLLEDLRLNPSRYVHISVFGKKNKEKQK